MTIDADVCRPLDVGYFVQFKADAMVYLHNDVK